MLCSGCAAHVAEALDALPGVRRAVVSFADGVAHFEAARDVSPETLEHAVAAAGYTARATFHLT